MSVWIKQVLFTELILIIMRSMYILKIQGKGKVPDHIQLRDEMFRIVAYFKITNPKTSLARCNLLHKADEILKIANSIEYGKIRLIDL